MNTIAFLATGQLAELLGVPAHRLSYLTRDRQIRPRKGATGAFLWTFDEATRAARLLKVAPPSEAAFQEAAGGRW